MKILKFLKKFFLSNFRCDIRYRVNIDAGNPNLHLVLRLEVRLTRYDPLKAEKFEF